MSLSLSLKEIHLTIVAIKKIIVFQLWFQFKVGIVYGQKQLKWLNLSQVDILIYPLNVSLNYQNFKVCF